MFKYLLGAVTLVGSVSFASSQLPGTAKTYSIALNPHATAYDGEKFDRHFQLTTTLQIAEKIVAQAKTYDSEICDYDDNGQASNCQDVCVSSVEFTAGKLLTKAQDLDSGKVVRAEKDLKLTARSESVAGKCNGSAPQLNSQAASVFGYRSASTEVSFARNDQQTLAFVFDTFTADIKNLGNNTYEVTQLNLSDKISGAAYYTHVSKDMLTWGVWNLVREGQIVREPGYENGF